MIKISKSASNKFDFILIFENPRFFLIRELFIVNVLQCIQRENRKWARSVLKSQCYKVYNALIKIFFIVLEIVQGYPQRMILNDDL